MKAPKLTLKQEAFCRAYIENGDAQLASEASGLKLGLVAPKSGSYVYLLLCPEMRNIIYVGKGTGSRMHHHERDVRAGRVSGAKKTAAIRGYMENGGKVVPVVFSAGLSSEDALSLEKAMILEIGRDRLTNSLSGTGTPVEVALERVNMAIARLLPWDEWVRRFSPTPERKELGWRVRAELFDLREDLMRGVYTSKVDAR